MASPALWGSRARIVELFGAAAAGIAAEPRQFMFRYRSAEHMLEVFRSYYGPILKAFAARDADGQHALAEDLVALMKRFDRAQGDGLVVVSDYLEIIITRR